MTNPELNREYPEPGEASLIEEMVKVTVERMAPQQGRIRRGQHAKPTGCVRGVFTIRDDIADDLRYGVFRQPNRSFQAIVRFSNSAETMEADGKAAARGIAVRLLDVIDSPEGRSLAEECEAMAFSPWNALTEHRPMGGINRLRQAVYLASQAMRAVKKDNPHSDGKTGEATKALIGKGSPK